MKKVLSAILTFCTGIHFFAMHALAAVSTQTAQNSSVSPLRLLFVIGIVLMIWGLYRSRKERIVVFANLTDVLVTLATPVLPIVAYFLCLFIGIEGRLMLWIMLLPGATAFVYVIKATRAYNRSIDAGFLDFLHAILTKYFIVGLYVLALLLVFQYGGASKRKYERESTRLRRARRNTAAGIAASSFVFAILTFFGLWTHEFISLNSYVSGLWGDEEEDAPLEDEVIED